MPYFLYNSLEPRTFIFCVLSFLHAIGIPQNSNKNRRFKKKKRVSEKLMNCKYFPGKTLVSLEKKIVHMFHIYFKNMVTLAGVRSSRSEDKGHVTQVLTHLANTKLLLLKIWRLLSAENKQGKGDCLFFNTSPTSLSMMMTTQTMPDSAHPPMLLFSCQVMSNSL